MDRSLITLEAELVTRVKSYLDGKLAFRELAYWVEDRMEEWDKFALKSAAMELSGSVLLTLYEDQHGDHTSESIRERIAEDYAEIVGSRALP
jgi:hypothetical protein